MLQNRSAAATGTDENGERKKQAPPHVIRRVQPEGPAVTGRCSGLQASLGGLEARLQYQVREAERATERAGSATLPCALPHEDLDTTLPPRVPFGAWATQPSQAAQPSSQDRLPVARLRPHSGSLNLPAAPGSGLELKATDASRQFAHMTGAGSGRMPPATSSGVRPNGTRVR